MKSVQKPTKPQNGLYNTVQTREGYIHMEEEKKANVTNINKKELEKLEKEQEKERKRLEKEKKQQEKENEKKFTPVDAQRHVTAAISRFYPPGIGTMPEFEQRYHAVQIEPGIREILREEENRLVSYVSLEAVMDDILNYTADKLADIYAYKWDTKQCLSAAKYWLSRTRPIPKPTMVAWADQDVLTFSKLQWVFNPNVKESDTPLFNEMMGRISNSRALMEWIGGLLDPDWIFQQYVWLQGQGGDGKGTLIRFLEKVMGNAFQAMAPHNTPHWSDGLIGKRLVVFPDLRNVKFIDSEIFMSVTGYDRIPINPKFGKIYSTRIPCGVIAVTNKEWDGTSEKSAYRRIIYCKMKGLLTLPNTQYEQQLWKEGGNFLSRCIIYHQSVKRTGTAIFSSDRNELDDYLSEKEEPFEVAVSQGLVFHKNACITGAELQAFINERFLTKNEREEFRKYLKRKYDIEKKTTTIIGINVDGIEITTTPNMWQGICIKHRKYYIRIKADLLTYKFNGILNSVKDLTLQLKP